MSRIKPAVAATMAAWSSSLACGSSAASHKGKRISSEATVPLPGSLSIATTPPISSDRRRQMVSPRPVPPKRRAVLLSAWVNGSNSRASCWRSMPMPVSATSKRSHCSLALLCRQRTRSVTCPCCVNFSALLQKFCRIWRRRSGSKRSAGATCSSMSSRNHSCLRCASSAYR
ncbi:hypothetical protein D3C78_1502850 [compost metagenome]